MPVDYGLVFKGLKITIRGNNQCKKILNLNYFILDSSKFNFSQYEKMV